MIENILIKNIENLIEINWRI